MRGIKEDAGASGPKPCDGPVGLRADGRGGKVRMLYALKLDRLVHDPGHARGGEGPRAQGWDLVTIVDGFDLGGPQPTKLRGE